MNERHPFSPRQALWKLICLFLGLILVLMLSVTAGFRKRTDVILLLFAETLGDFNADGKYKVASS